LISRDELLKTIIESMKQKFNIQLDFDNPNLETWLAQILSILDENQLMYLTLLMNESFLTTALLPSTIKKFALDYGYIYKDVQPAHGDLDIFVVLNDESNIDIEFNYDTKFVSSTGVVYIPQRKVYLSYSRNSHVANILSYDIAGNKFIDFIPYCIL